MDRNQELEDGDDFDIYADLDDNDIVFTPNTAADDIAFDIKTVTTDSEVSPNAGRNVGSDEETIGTNGDMIGSNDGLNESIAKCDESVAQKSDNSVDNSESFDSKCDNNVSNDLILNELTILENNLHKSEDVNKTLEAKNEELRKQLDLKDKQLSVLKRNISSLFKTAKEEIARHKREIDGLRQELDTIIFRRLRKVDNSEESKSRSNAKTVNGNGSQTNEKDVRQKTETVHKKSPDSSVRSPKQHNNVSRRRSRSKSSQRQRRSRSRDRRHRDRSRDRNGQTERSGHRSNGDKDSKWSTLGDRKEEDRKRRSDTNDSKSRNDSKKTRTDKK